MHICPYCGEFVDNPDAFCPVCSMYFEPEESDDDDNEDMEDMMDDEDRDEWDEDEDEF